MVSNKMLPSRIEKIVKELEKENKIETIELNLSTNLNRSFGINSSESMFSIGKKNYTEPKNYSNNNIEAHQENIFNKIKNYYDSIKNYFFSK